MINKDVSVGNKSKHSSSDALQATEIEETQNGITQNRDILNGCLKYPFFPHARATYAAAFNATQTNVAKTAAIFS